MSANDFQSDVHQAVDLGFAAADLISSFFSSQAKVRRYNRHVLHTDANGSQVTLSLDQNNQPVLACTGPTTTTAVIVPTTTQTQAIPIPAGQVAAQPIILAGQTQIPFSQFPNFTKGMITATQVDTNTAGGANTTPICATTLRDFSDAQQVPLLFEADGTTPQLSLDVGTSSFTLYNADPNNSYNYSATITTTSPNQTFTLLGQVGTGGQTTTQFPDNIGATVIGQMTIVVATVAQTSPTGPGYQLSPTSGSVPYVPPSNNM
ncbi:hypothetical protein RugamoR64_38580 [Duganella rhizosphaerae]|uniref:hypothetical protein n=1 Tax=Duganella rhizosphaerae TaxID=2885763 RepID=UPI0030EA47E4